MAPTPDLVIVTGAGRGIGRSIAKALSKHTSILCISRTERASETAFDIRVNGGEAESLALDLADYEAAGPRLSEWFAARTFRRIAGVFAAATLGPCGPLHSNDISAWDQAFRVNVWGNLAVARSVLAENRRHGFGRLLFFAGGGAAYAYPAFPAYAASKAALVRIVENLHEDMKDQADFATAILAPGAVETDTLALVRASGAEVRTTVPIEEPTAFATDFILSERCGFSGRFVHVRDEWQRYLNSGEQIQSPNLWKLRRVE
jgi:NAD(P)-dependent dehydrogenase (short-subunit alcohol dehydrogenase family)